MDRGQPQAEKPGPGGTTVGQGRRNGDDAQIARVVQRMQGGIEPSLRTSKDRSEMVEREKHGTRRRRGPAGHGRQVIEETEIAPQVDRQAQAEDIHERAASELGQFDRRRLGGAVD